MTGMLASVKDLGEARLALGAGADIIDLKQPASGALGALPAENVAEIVRTIAGRVPVSATIGDKPMDPAPLHEAAVAMAATGVDYVKVGFFPGGDWAGSISALSKCAKRGIRLIAVLFADTAPNLTVIERLSGAGFAGVMLDTMDKSNGSLRDVYRPSELEDFVGKSNSHRLLCGLAGSLRIADIEPLRALSPDYLGFRGALCRRSTRTENIDVAAITDIRNRIPATRPQAAAF